MYIGSDRDRRRGFPSAGRQGPREATATRDASFDQVIRCQHLTTNLALHPLPRNAEEWRGQGKGTVDGSAAACGSSSATSGSRDRRARRGSTIRFRIVSVRTSAPSIHSGSPPSHGPTVTRSIGAFDDNKLSQNQNPLVHYSKFPQHPYVDLQQQDSNRPRDCRRGGWISVRV